jgi:hypothetical protein
MPFTLSHPAAVVPIRKYGILSALVVGSMMPDTLYFLPGMRHDSYGHTLPGLFFYCLPAGISLLWFFHRFLKKPLIALFPRNQHGKLLAVSPDFHLGPARRFAAIAASIVIGAASHLTWDSFTHSNGWIASRFAIFHYTLPFPSPFGLQVTEALQYSNSLLGLLVLSIYYQRWLRDAASPAHATELHLPSAVRVFMLGAFAVGSVAPAVALMVSNPALWLHFRRGLLGYGAVDGIKIVCLEILVFAAAWHLVHGQSQAQESSIHHSSKP